MLVCRLGIIIQQGVKGRIVTVVYHFVFRYGNAVGSQIVPGGIDISFGDQFTVLVPYRSVSFLPIKCQFGTVSVNSAQIC